jgi:hypothetical protein
MIDKVDGKQADDSWIDEEIEQDFSQAFRRKK